MTDTTAPAGKTDVETPESAGDQGAVTGGAFGKKGLGWALFEWARNPYYNVIVIYVFASYFSTVLVGDGVRGQALMGMTIGIAGVIMAIGAPIIGVLVDKGGGKKGFIAVAFIAIIACTLGMWWMKPGVPNVVPMAMALMVVGYSLYTVLEILHNSMLPGAGDSKALPMVSGLGLALGNLAGVVMLVILIVANEQSDWVKSIPGGVGSLSGLAVAIWMSIFVIPFFLMMPDHKGSLGSWSLAIKETFSRESFKVRGSIPVLSFLASLIINPAIFVREKFKAYPNVMRYLLARMIYADGTAVLFTMAGVYVAGVLKYSATEIMVYGIAGSLFGALGGFLGAKLDRWIGPKRALIIELSLIVVFLILQVSITSDSLLFGLIDGSQIVWSGPLFQTLSKMTYVLMVIPGAIIIVAAISSSRYMLVHIAPPERIGEFYGFYSMAGSVTVWIAPMVVAYVTMVTNSQRAGMAAISLLFIVGIAILFTVKSDKTPEHMKTPAS